MGNEEGILGDTSVDMDRTVLDSMVYNLGDKDHTLVLDYMGHTLVDMVCRTLVLDNMGHTVLDKGHSKDR